jgi:hypothetical protein
MVVVKKERDGYDSSCEFQKHAEIRTLPEELENCVHEAE